MVAPLLQLCLFCILNKLFSVGYVAVIHWELRYLVGNLLERLSSFQLSKSLFADDAVLICTLSSDMVTAANVFEVTLV